MTNPNYADWNVKTDAAVVANGRDYGAEFDQRTPAVLKVFLLVTGMLVVLIAACLVVWAFSPFDDGPAFSTAPLPGSEVRIPQSLLVHGHSARVAS
jgi:hypothetical protein